MAGRGSCRRIGSAPFRGCWSWVVVALLAVLLGAVVTPLSRPAYAVGRRSTLEAALKSDASPAARQRAAAALGDLGDTDALQALIVALFADRDATVRAACADALAALAERSALPALRAATRDDSLQVRKQAQAAVNRLSPARRPSGGGRRITVVVGRSGSKAQSGTLPNIPKVLREAVVKEMQSSSELDVIEDLDEGQSSPSGYTVDSSVIKLSRITTPAGELEVSCDVSMIIAALPGRNVVSMVSGGASVIGPRGPSTKPTRAFLESLETEAVQQAVKETHSNLLTFLRTRPRP